MSFLESPYEVNYTLILTTGSKSAGFEINLKPSSSQIYIVKSVSSELCTVSTTPEAMQMMSNDEIRGVSIYSTVTSHFSSIRVSEFLELPIVQGMLLKVDLRRMSTLNCSTATSKGKVRSLAKSYGVATAKGSLDAKETLGCEYLMNANMTEMGFEEGKDSQKVPATTDPSENLRSEVLRLRRELLKSVPKTKLQESERKCEELRKQLDDANQRLRAADAANQRLMSKCSKERDESKTRIASLEAQLNVCSDERDESKTRIASLDEILTVCSNEVSELRTALSLAEDMIMGQDNELRELRDVLADLRSDLDSKSAPESSNSSLHLQQELGQGRVLDVPFADSITLVGELSGTEAWADLNGRMRASDAELNARYGALEAQFSSSKSDWDAERTKLEDILGSNSVKYNTLVSTLHQRETEWEGKYVMLEGRLAEEAKALQQELSVTKAVLDEIKAAKESRDAEIRDLLRRLVDFEEVTLQLSTANAGWEKRFVELEQASAATEDDKKAKGEVVTQLRDRIKGLEHQIEDMKDANKSAMEEAEAKFNEVSQLLSATKQSLGVSDSERNELLAAKFRLQALLEEKVGRYEESLVRESELRSQLDMANAVLVDTVATVEHLKQVKVKLQEKESRFVDMTIKLEETERLLQSAKDAASDANKAWEERYAALENRSSQELLDWEERHKQLESRLAEETKTLEALLGDKNKEFEEVFARKSGLLNQLDVTKVLLVNSMEEVTIRELERRFADLKQCSKAVQEGDARAADLEKQLQDTKQALQEMRGECSRLASINENLQGDLERTNARLSDTTEALATSRQETSSISTENGSLAAELREARGAFKDYEELRTCLENTQQTLESTEQCLEKMTADRANIEAEYSAFRLRSEKTMNEMIRVNQAEIEASGERCADLQRRLNEMREIRYSLKERLEEAEAALTETQEQLEIARAGLAEADARVEELTVFNSELLSANEVYKADDEYLASLKSRVEDTEDKLAEANYLLEASVPRSELMECESRCQDLRRQIGDMTTTLDDMMQNMARMSDCEDELVAARKAIQSRVPIENYMKLESKCMELTQQLNDWQRAYESFEGQLKDKDLLLVKNLKQTEELRMQLSNTYRRLDDLVEVNEELKLVSNNLMLAKQQIVEYEEELIVAKRTVDEMKAAMGTLTFSNRSQESAYTQVFSELKDAKARSAYLQNRCDELENQIFDANTALVDLRERNSSLESGLNLASKESERHQSMVLEQLGQIESLASERVCKVRQEVEEKLTRTFGLQIMELEAKIDELGGENAKLLSELSSNASKLECCTKELQALRLKELSSVGLEQYRQVEDRCDDLQRRLNDMRDSRYSLKAALQEKEEELAECMKKLQTLRQ